MGNDHEDLLVRQRSTDLALPVYRATDSFPRNEMFGLTNQVRRSAVSVAANIAKGQGRRYRREFIHHLSIAHGPLSETRTHLYLAPRLGFIDAATYETLRTAAQEVGRLLGGLIRSLEKNTPGEPASPQR